MRKLTLGEILNRNSPVRGLWRAADFRSAADVICDCVERFLGNEER